MFPCPQRLVCIVGAALAGLGAPSRADIHLRGVSEQNGEVSLLLKHSLHPLELEWVVPGGSFRGYVVKSYDPAREVVHLHKDSQALEARLAGAPAKIPPARHEASHVTEKAGVRCCAVHGTPLVEAPGFVTLTETTACYSLSYVMSVAPKKEADFPNSFGGSISREKSPLYPVEILREHCVRCDAAYARCLAQIKAMEPASRGEPTPSPFTSPSR